jgi:hypothetical protein
VYVVDPSVPAVRIYDRFGRHIRSFGRAGRGPGEMIQPTSVEVDSLVHVFDPAQQRTVSYSRNGEHLRTARFDIPLPMSVLRTHSMRSGYTLIHSLPTFALGRPEHQPNELLLARSNTGSVDTIASFHSGGAMYHPEGRTMPWGVIQTDLGRGGAWAVTGDSALVVIDGRSGVLTRYSFHPDGYRVVQRVRLDVQGAPPDGSDATRARRQLEQTTRRSARGFRILLPPYRSAFTGAVSAGDAGTWLQGRVDNGKTHVVFVPSLTGPLREFELDGRIRLLSADTHQLLTAVERADGTILLRMYQWHQQQAKAW